MDDDTNRIPRLVGGFHVYEYVANYVIIETDCCQSVLPAGSPSGGRWEDGMQILPRIKI